MRMKKIAIAAAAACLAATMMIGGTLAYLTVNTGSKVNNFTFVGGVTAELKEPNWDKETDPGKDLLPGANVAKDPIIYNTCDVTEWVAIKLTFCKGSSNGQVPLTTSEIQTVMDNVTIDYNADNLSGSKKWARLSGDAASGTQKFYYTELLPVKNGAGDANTSKTEPLFTKVKIKDDADTAALNTIGGFEIYVEGCAIQGSAAADSTAAAVLDYTFVSDPKNP